MNWIIAPASILWLCTAAARPGAQEQAQVPASSTFSQEQLEQMAAPIALYPDALLMQIAMAAT